MGVRGVRVLVAAACLLWLSGCETSTKLTGLFSSHSSDQASLADPNADPSTTGSLSEPTIEPNGGSSGVVGQDPNDEVSLGKKHYLAGNFGNAERHFRRAVELHPRDAEAWVGLAACYDRLKRFDLADRAYAQAIALIGETPEVLNNKGYSLLLRGDYSRARTVLLKAQAMAPDNPYVQNNLKLLEKTQRQGKAAR